MTTPFVSRPHIRLLPARHAAFLVAVLVTLASCRATERIVAPVVPPAPEPPPGGVVISQVYGGGGNAGATFRNDFVELYNNTPAAVNLEGWSVQYASATGTTWQVTTLPALSIRPGQYLLVQQAPGAAGTVSLPTPDASGVIAMSATAGKIALLNNSTALTEMCPVGGNATVVDFVGYGAANCAESTPTAVLSNTTAALRKSLGTTDSDNNTSDFTTDGAPVPRNSGSIFTAPTGSGKVLVRGPVATVTTTSPSGTVAVGATTTLVAVATDAKGVRALTTFSFVSGNPAVATINAITGIATGVSVGTTRMVAKAANGISADSVTITVTPAAATLTLSSRTDSLPVGFQTQLFATGFDASGTTITSNTQVNWRTDNPSVITVSAAGVLSAIGAGTTRISATARTDGTTTGTTTIVVNVPTTSPTVRIGHNTDLGVPTDVDPSDDLLITRRQYTLSYNARRVGPNWVSWNLDASHKGSASRCNCFTADPAVAAFGLPAFDTNDWINGGAFSRGHMSPSADRAASAGENAPTFYLSNMLPQNQTLNGGAWGALENDLRVLAVGTVQIYIVSGPVYTRNRTGAGIDGLGFLASTTQPNRIAIPDSIWKIAIVVPNTNDVTTIGSPSAVQVIAAMFPNSAIGTGTSTANAWVPFSTTIAAIERSTGYNFLSRIPESVQCRLETRVCVP
ncbi:DNA/RNA non-specific endonuclease [Gemmatimonas sp.]|uniref:DNA/RNA non-specific endonuclease n=2 Tax=Gemmatimonas sp. TaxID=1962908 RepID=UPI00356B5426